MRRHLLASTAAALAVVLAPGFLPRAHANVLFQSIPNLTVNPTVNAWCSPCGGSYRVYDTFMLGSAASVSRIDFAIQTEYDFPTTVTVGIYTLSNGLPGTQLFSQVFAPSSFTYVNTMFDTSIVSVSPNNLALAAGSYDITFYSSCDLAVPGYADPGGVLYQSGAGFHSGQSAGFDLVGAARIPEPASTMLIGVGLLGIGMIRRRKAA
jgi:hypothetical protein